MSSILPPHRAVPRYEPFAPAPRLKGRAAAGPPSLSCHIYLTIYIVDKRVCHW